MASTNFVDKFTVIATAWLNEVNALVHGVFQGAQTQSQARANLGAAASGVNSDIQSLSGLTTPLSVVQGGTGATTPAAARVNLDARPAFQGVLLSKNADQTITVDTQLAVTWDVEIYDTGSFHDAVNPGRITIPPGVSWARFSGQVDWSSGSNSAWRTLYLIKNGVLSADPGGTFRLVGDDAANNFLTQVATSAVIPVVAGDFFELFVFHSGTLASLVIHGTASSGLNDFRTWFAMEVVG